MTVQHSPQTDNVSRSVEEQGTTTISLKTGSSEMTVELENVLASDLRAMQRSIQNENERGWLKKLRKKIKSVVPTIKDLWNNKIVKAHLWAYGCTKATTVGIGVGPYTYGVSVGVAIALSLIHI